MTEIRRSDPAHDAPPSLEDVLVGVIEEMLRSREGPGHIVTEWVVSARMIDPDGRKDGYIVWNTGLDEIVARGLADMLADAVNDWKGEDVE